MATNFVAKLWQNYLPACTYITSSFRNGMGYRYLNVCINSEMMPLYRVKIS